MGFDPSEYFRYVNQRHWSTRPGLCKGNSAEKWPNIWYSDVQCLHLGVLKTPIETSGQIIIIRRSLGRFIYFETEIRFRSREITNYFRSLGHWKRRYWMKAAQKIRDEEIKFPAITCPPAIFFHSGIGTRVSCFQFLDQFKICQKDGLTLCVQRQELTLGKQLGQKDFTGLLEALQWGRCELVLALDQPRHLVLHKRCLCLCGGSGSGSHSQNVFSPEQLGGWSRCDLLIRQL